MDRREGGQGGSVGHEREREERRKRGKKRKMLPLGLQCDVMHADILENKFYTSYVNANKMKGGRELVQNVKETRKEGVERSLHIPSV